MRATAALIAIAVLVAVPASASAATTIKLGDNFFKPTQKTIGKGTKVNFEWIGNRRHNVTKTRGPGGAIESATTKRRGVNFAKRFGAAGTYRFICTVHPIEMKLKLVVK